MNLYRQLQQAMGLKSDGFLGHCILGIKVKAVELTIPNNLPDLKNSSMALVMSSPIMLQAVL